MAWITATDMPIHADNQPGGGPNDTIYQYYKYRYLKGTVQIRLTDISPSDGSSFTTGQIWFKLYDSSGKSYGSHWVTKQWGVIGPWTSVGFVSGGKPIRLGVLHSWPIPVSFTAQMRYNNSNAG